MVNLFGIATVIILLLVLPAGALHERLQEKSMSRHPRLLIAFITYCAALHCIGVGAANYKWKEIALGLVFALVSAINALHFVGAKPQPLTQAPQGAGE